MGGGGVAMEGNDLTMEMVTWREAQWIRGGEGVLVIVRAWARGLVAGMVLVRAVSL